MPPSVGPMMGPGSHRVPSTLLLLFAYVAGAGSKCPKPIFERVQKGEWKVFNGTGAHRQTKHLGAWFAPDGGPECGIPLPSQEECIPVGKVVAVGDSITRFFVNVFAGMLHDHRQHVFTTPGRVRGKFRINVDDKGPENLWNSDSYTYRHVNESCDASFQYIRGFAAKTPAVMKDRIRKHLPKGASLVLANIGAHFLTKPLDSFEGYVNGIWTALAESDAKEIIWITITPQFLEKKPQDWKQFDPNPRVVNLNARAAEMMAVHPLFKQPRVSVMDTFKMMDTRVGLYFSLDGSHWWPQMDVVRSSILLEHWREQHPGAFVPFFPLSESAPVFKHTPEMGASPFQEPKKKVVGRKKRRKGRKKKRKR